MDNLDFYLNFGITAILLAIKNPAKKASLKKAMLKVRDAINIAYAGDPDFTPKV